MKPRFTPNSLYALATLFFALLVAGCSLESDPLPPPPDQMIPLSPTNLVGQALAADSINLEWTDRSENEQGFEIHESIGDNSNFALLLSVDDNLGCFRWGLYQHFDGSFRRYHLRRL